MGRKKLIKWRLLYIGGSILVGSSAFFVVVLLNFIYFKNTNVVLSLSLLPIPMTSILVLMTVYFSVINKRVIIDNFDEMIDFCSNVLFPSTKRSLRIASGTLDPTFYNEKIAKSLEAVKGRGAKIEILFTYPEKKEARETLAKAIKGRLSFLKDSLFVLPKTFEGKHFMIIDGTHLRVEEKHPPEVSMSRNSIYFFSDLAVFHLKKEYESLRSTAEKVK